MSSRNTVVTSVLLAVIIAAGVIVAYSSLGGFVASTTKSSSNSSSSSTESSVTQVISGMTTNQETSATSLVGSTNQVTATSTNFVSQTSSTTASSGGTQSANGQSGTLAVLMTDPPTVPSGVTAVYITYSNLAVHVSNAGNQTGWHVLKQSGQINLMSVINFTETLSTSNITSGNFNALGFNITSAIITYQGQNYTAYLVYGHNQLFVPIVGGISIQKGVTSVAVIDIAPTVLLLTNSSSSTNFSFAFIPTATAYTVPAQSVPSLHLIVGARDDIHAALWWIIILHQTHFEITSAKLTPNVLSVTVMNTGNASVVFHEVQVSTTTSKSGGVMPASVLSELFVCEPNASLVPTSGVRGLPSALLIAAGGYLLAPGASVTFTYSGSFSIGGFPLPVAASSPVMTALTTEGTVTTTTSAQTSATLTPQGVVAGQRYVITVFGNFEFAQTEVTATSS